MIKFLIYLLLFYIISRLIFGRLSGSGGFKTRVYRFDTHHHYHQPEEKKEEGRITVNPKIDKDDKGGNAGNIGEYVDYEEVK
jgi:hypothetical protein